MMTMTRRPGAGWWLGLLAALPLAWFARPAAAQFDHPYASWNALLGKQVRWLPGAMLLPVLTLALTGAAVAQPLLPDPLGGEARAGGSGWTLEKLPAQSFAVTEFRRVEADAEPELRIEANASYGNLVYRLPMQQPIRPSAQLGWRWRLETPNPRADLLRKGGDDTSVKVCLLFDMALERVPFLERQLLRAARASTGQELPAATVCYVWDPALPAGTRLDNAHSRRVRYLVLRGSGDPVGAWASERRDIAADFRLLFGAEAGADVPPLQALALGADADNTGARSVAFVTGLRLTGVGGR